MLNYQTAVYYHPPVAMPGQLWSVDVFSRDYVTGISTFTTTPGTIVVGQTTADYTRRQVTLADGSAAPTVDNYYALDRFLFDENTHQRVFLGDNVTTQSFSYPALKQLRLMRKGALYLICEKAIADPTLPVYVRKTNPVTPLEGIGFVTDTADGADTVALPNARFLGRDTFTFAQTLEPTLTPLDERNRTGMTVGFGLVPVAIRS
jgi:hypothetical protein